ncbi:MAG: hypothetical protein Q8P07_04690 [bacterium]|nr:hypothetical protein [bacterium]
MITQTAEKIYREVKELRKETEFLKNAVLSIMKDPEGDYKPSFVGKILKRALENPKKIYKFTTPENFIRHIRSAK